MRADCKEILVADDEPGFQALFRFMLEPLGFKVLTVGNGTDAVESALKNDFAIVFLDVHMPKLTGPQALKKIKQSKPDQPIVILSSSIDPEKTNDETHRLGAAACFQKPFQTKEIFQIVDMLTGRSSSKGD
jgi:CheY-like chemotaxis protein